MVAPVEPTNPSELFSPFVPAVVVVPQEQDRLSVFLTDKLSQFADVINDKTIGTFTQVTEAFNGEKWIYDTTKKLRNGYQAIARIPSFPNAGILVLTLTSNPKFPISNITPQFVITHVWGSASRPCTATGAGDGDYFSFMNRGDPRIIWDMSDTTITITTTVDLSAYSGFLVIQYLRDGV
jgi:hypothetical protein